MTDREFYTNIVNGTINDEMVEKAEAKIVALDARNAHAKDKRNEKNAATDEAVLAVLTAEPQTATEIGAQIDFHASKVTASCKRLAEAGKVAIGSIKNDKGRDVKSYALA